jgi:2-hydroxychromene-2-carboxylate isomerase
MARPKVKFYFAFNSPYAFLSSTRIDQALAPRSVELECKPIYSPRTGPPPDFNSPRFRYIFQDVQRFAAAYGLTLNPGPFADTGKACAGFFFAEAQGRGKAYRDAVYAARWQEGKDIGEEAVLGEIAEKCGLDRGAALATLADPTYRQALEQSNRDGEADGVFGFPFFVYGDQKFWGNDRIEWLVRAIEAA